MYRFKHCYLSTDGARQEIHIKLLLNRRHVGKEDLRSFENFNPVGTNGVCLFAIHGDGDWQIICILECR
eukprot:1007909-Pleurochrysis_carterae.AAC.1